LAKVTLARKIASIALRLWKKGELWDPGMKDVGDYFHGQEEGYYLPGQTHGCLSYGRDYEFINYMWNLPPQQIPVAVDVPVVP
jgi:hypothetical protein